MKVDHKEMTMEEKEDSHEEYVHTSANGPRDTRQHRCFPGTQLDMQLEILPIDSSDSADLYVQVSRICLLRKMWCNAHHPIVESSSIPEPSFTTSTPLCLVHLGANGAINAAKWII